jgi:hypothetical protein
MEGLEAWKDWTQQAVASREWQRWLRGRELLQPIQEKLFRECGYTATLRTVLFSSRGGLCASPATSAAGMDDMKWHAGPLLCFFARRRTMASAPMQILLANVTGQAGRREPWRSLGAFYLEALEL